MGPIQTAVGFEIVENDLRIAVVQTRFGKLRLLHSQQISEFERLSEEDKKSSIASVVNEQRLQHAKAFLTLPRRLGLIRQTELPIEIGDRLRSTIALQIESQSPWNADEIYWDCMADRISKDGPKTMKVTTAIIPRAVLDPWIALFRSAGLSLSGAALSSLAHAHAAISLWPDASSGVLLSCEPSSLEGTILRDGSVAAFSTDETGTKDWAGDAGTVLSRLFSLCKLKPADDALVVAFGPSSSAVETSEAASLPIEGVDKPTSAIFGSVAAALMAVRSSRFSVNLVPPAERFRRNHLQLLPTYSLIFLAVILGLAALLRGPHQWRQYGTSLDAEIAKLTPAVQEVSAQEAEWSKANEKYLALKSRVEGRDLNLETLRELSRILPQDCFLATYTAQGRNVTLSGYAPSASSIQKLLEESPTFEEVQFTSAVTRDPSGKERFTIKATVVGSTQ